MRLADGESQCKSEREERKEETSRKSETVRLAIINHIRSWRPPRILATRQTLRLPSVPFPSCSRSLVTLVSHPASGRALKSGCGLDQHGAHSFYTFVRKQSQHDDLNLESTSTLELEFTASLPGCSRRPEKRNILVFTPASASVLHFVTFPSQTLSTQKLLKAVIWKWDTVLKSQTHSKSRHFFPLATHARLILILWVKMHLVAFWNLVVCIY